MALSRFKSQTSDHVDEMVIKAVFLDRDGVLNANCVRDDRFVAPTVFEEFKLLPNVGHAVERLKDMGFVVIVCTNQPDQTNGRSTPAALNAMNDYLSKYVAIDDIFVCPHVDEDKCDCRKPKPGLLMRAAHDHHIDISSSYMVGDRWRDIDAGRNAGVKAALLVNCADNESRLCSAPPDGIFPSLIEAVDAIINIENIEVRV